MDLYEYQAKDLLENYDLKVQKGIIAYNSDDAIKAFNTLGGKLAIIKAQILAGGRGKAGGVKLVKSVEEVIEITKTLIGKNLITSQTSSKGQLVNFIGIFENVYPVLSELYLGAIIDKSRSKIIFIASSQGGIDIEEIAYKFPEKIFKVEVDILIGLQFFQARDIAFKLKLKDNQVNNFTKIMLNSYKAFIECDFTLLEINPLVLKDNNEFICVDTKINIDPNALYRHKNFLELKDKFKKNNKELKASKYGLNYISLNGNIGCMVNGAGLAMATMDMIKLYGGEPANFLDISGSATEDRVIEGLKLIIENNNVKAILINIFGGIIHCDMIAKAIIKAINEINIILPLVVRLEGNNAKNGLKILANSGLKLIYTYSLSDATKKVVNLLNIKN